MRLFCAAVTCGLICAPAFAQTAAGSAAGTTTPAPPIQDDEPKPLAGATEPLAQVPAAAPTPEGPFKHVGETLADKGIYLRAILVNEFAGNVTGGQGKGAADSFATAFGGDLDLDRIAGLKGGVLRVTFNKSVGESLAAKDTLNAISYQTRFKTFQNLRLAVLTYDQDLWNGKVNVVAGRVSALSYFNASPIYCNFQSNSVCFNPAVVPIGDRGLSFFPYGTWGGRVKVSPSKKFYVQAGVFEDNTALQPTGGFNFSTRKATGVQIPVEIGFQSAKPTEPLAYHLRIGGYWNTSPYKDPYLNSLGRPLIPNGGTALVHDGLRSWYVMGDVVLYRPQSGSKRNLTLFGGTMATIENYAPWKSQTLVGMVYTGPFASRPTDTFGLVASFFRLGDQQVRFLDAARRKGGGVDPAYRAEAIIEANYGVQLYRGIRFNPNVQYVLHPDNNLLPTARQRSRNILAFGARLTIELGDYLGLPTRR